MVLNFDALRRSTLSRFWLTFATVWLVGWLSLGSVHALTEDCGDGGSHCLSLVQKAQVHGHHSCALCHFGNLPLVASAQTGQLVFSAPLIYVAAAVPEVSVPSCRFNVTPIQRRGPPAQLHFA